MTVHLPSPLDRLLRVRGLIISSPATNQRCTSCMAGSSSARPMVTTPSDVPKAGQQRDEKKVSRTRPNYDLFFFEVETRSGIKMLPEMRLGEMGNMVASTPILPRYRIGDLISAFRSPYFCCIGRDKWWTPLWYAWDELRTFNLDRL